MTLLAELFSIVEKFVLEYWTLFLGIVFIVYGTYIAFVLARRAYLMKLHNKTFADLEKDMITLSLKFPKENLRSPQAMEQVFASMQGYYSFGFNFKLKWILGEIEKWTSLEIVGNAGSVKFYARIHKKLRRLLENGLFAQYPEIEIREVPDYFESLPEELPNDKFDLWGTDLVLARENHYPIRTYVEYDSPDEEQRLDPISMITEVMANLKDDEWMMLHVLFRPTGKDFFPNYEKDAQKQINKISGKKEPPGKPGFISIFLDFFLNLIKALNPWDASELQWGGGKKEEKMEFSKFPNPAEVEEMKAIDRKLSKIPFECIVRWLYIDNREDITSSNVFNLMGSVKQWDTKNFNSLRPSGATFTYLTKVGLFAHDTSSFFRKYINKSDIFFRGKRLAKRKKKVYQLFRHRIFPANTQPMTYHKAGSIYLKSYILNAEELASIFHPPGFPVKAQKLEQIYTRKGGPPDELPIIE
ncbi:MAG TPA: hypothetical protein VI432_01065 [Candidatus Paceibacterota bacterium]